MPKGTKTLGNNKARAWESLGLEHKKRGCAYFDTPSRSGKKWFPCNKGGSFRKWYGNQDYIINWENNGYEVKSFCDEKGKQRSVIRNPKCYYLEAISWSSISSTAGIAFRYYPKGFIFDHAACNIYTNNITMTLGYLNTKLVDLFSNIINPTLNLFSGALGNIPYLAIKGLEPIVQQNISISKLDWDTHETSWDFETNPLLAIGGGCVKIGTSSFFMLKAQTFPSPSLVVS